MEPILLLPSEQLGEKAAGSNGRSQGTKVDSRGFSAGFGTCLIEECYLNCMCLANSANSSGLMPSLVWSSRKSFLQARPAVFHSDELLTESSAANVGQKLACPTQLIYMR